MGRGLSCLIGTRFAVRLRLRLIELEAGRYIHTSAHGSSSVIRQSRPRSFVPVDWITYSCSDDASTIPTACSNLETVYNMYTKYTNKQTYRHACIRWTCERSIGIICTESPFPSKQKESGNGVGGFVPSMW